MKRRIFVQGGSAALAVALTGCGGGDSDVALDAEGLDELEAARRKPRPTPAPTPEPTPAPAPAPTPAPAPGESAHNTTIPPAAQIVDDQAATWTVASGVVYRNSVATISSNVTLLLYFNKVVYQQINQGLWWKWDSASTASSPWVATTDPRVAAPPPPAGVYTFQQEFDDPSAPILRSKGGKFHPYFTVYGGHAQPDGPNGYRWWNDEQQVWTSLAYPPAPYNPVSVANSILNITAVKNTFPNSPKPYLSGALDTANGAWFDPPDVRSARGGFEQKYGYWEARCRMPRGKGLWSAFWLDGGIQAGVGGEHHGEIDIFETVGTPYVFQTVHDWWAATDPNDYYPHPMDYWTDFHVYGLLWTPDSIIWYVDGRETRRSSQAMAHRYRDLCGPLHIALNLSMGGWDGNPDSTTPFPCKMEIDYVRVKKA